MRITLEMKGPPPDVELWCQSNLDAALKEMPMGFYRNVIYQWVLRRGYGASTASEAVKLMLLYELKQGDLRGKGVWRPNSDSPFNKSKCWAYNLAR